MERSVLMSNYDCTLLDDGTMDTVIEVTDRATGKVEEFHYSVESVADYRSDDGCLDFDTFIDDVVIPDADSMDWEENE